MPRVWVITGPPAVGKSAVVSKVVLKLKSAGVIVGGIVTSERRAEGARVGFDIRDLTNGTHGELASVTTVLGPKVGRYRVNLSDLASVGAKGLSDAAKASEAIVIDEVGPMELVSPEFRRAVKACVSSGKPVLAVLHERMDDDLLNEVRALADSSVEVTPENREDVVDTLFHELLRAAGGSKAS